MKEVSVLQFYKNEWRVVNPKQVDDFSEVYYNAVSLWDKTTEKVLKHIITVCGNGHIDAILHLGLLYNDMGKAIEGNALIVKAYYLALNALPDKFNPRIHLLEWNTLENRPLLRAFQSYGLELMKEQNFEAAIKQFQFILKVNPKDNQGIRYLLLECLFHTERYTDIFKIKKEYLQEPSIEFLFGRVLALYILGDKEAAFNLYKKAKERHPYTAEELAKKRHIFPKDEFTHIYKSDEHEYPSGSRQEAYEYWRTTQLFWGKAKGIHDFIESKINNS